MTGLASGVTAIVAGKQQHVCALTDGGSVKCWGSNTRGELGAASTAGCSGGVEPCNGVPVEVAGLDRSVKTLGLGSNHTCAVTRSGGAKCWGDNTAGQAGDGTLVSRAAPTDVVGLTSGVVAIGGSQLATCALLSTGVVKCWGDDSLGGLGDGTTGDDVCSCRTTPFDVVGLTDEQPVSATVVPAAQLDWQSADQSTHIVSAQTASCGDSATANVYGVPGRLELQSTAGFQEGTTLLGLEADPYQYVLAQVRPLGSWAASPYGWQIVARYVLNGRADPNRMGLHELFLRRLDKPALLFRYSDDLCNADGSPAQPPEKLPGFTLALPPDQPHVVMHRQGDYLSPQAVIGNVMKNQPAGVRPVWLELGTSDEIFQAHGIPAIRSLSNAAEQVLWVVILDAGDTWGPKRAGHAHGMFTSLDASTGSTEGLAGGCCLDLLTAP